MRSFLKQLQVSRTPLKSLEFQWFSSSEYVEVVVEVNGFLEGDESLIRGMRRAFTCV